MVVKTISALVFACMLFGCSVGNIDSGKTMNANTPVNSDYSASFKTCEERIEDAQKIMRTNFEQLMAAFQFPCAPGHTVDPICLATWKSDMRIKLEVILNDMYQDILLACCPLQYVNTQQYEDCMNFHFSSWSIKVRDLFDEETNDLPPCCVANP